VTSRHRISAPAEAVGAVVDRLGSRAWALAVWTLGDETRAAEVVVAAFRLPALMPGGARVDDASLLCHVRREAVEVAKSTPQAPARRFQRRPDVDTDALSVPDAIALLPDAQREVIELATLGRLSATAIAGATGLPRGEVISLLAAAMRTMRTMLSGDETQSLRRDDASARRPAD
jgi:hypothetical protein